jgi:hypothetical protein
VFGGIFRGSELWYVLRVTSTVSLQYACMLAWNCERHKANLLLLLLVVVQMFKWSRVSKMCLLVVKDCS